MALYIEKGHLHSRWTKTAAQKGVWPLIVMDKSIPESRHISEEKKHKITIISS